MKFFFLYFIISDKWIGIIFLIKKYFYFIFIQAIPLYEQFKKDMSDVIGKEVQSGEFAAYMKVTLINDGPVTIIIDTKNKE